MNLINPSNRRGARLSVLGLAIVTVAASFAWAHAARPLSAQASALPAPSGSPDAVPTQPLPLSYSHIVDAVLPAVVTVRVDKQVQASMGADDPFGNFFGPTLPPGPGGHHESGLGSGVVIRSDGYVLTNDHVVDGAGRIRVDLADGRSLPATIAGQDPASDLALLRIDAPNLPIIRFGDSDRVKIGDLVLAFGNPLGVGETVTMGIISAKGRATGGDDEGYQDFLQTDAAINQGNSGGALVNTQGELVGINAEILSPSGGNVGLGFAIPSAMARRVADDLIEDGAVHRSKLGVTVERLTPDLAASLDLDRAHGALVTSVEPAGPAERAGLRQGDVITEVDRHPVVDPNALRNQIAAVRPGERVSLAIVRHGAPMTLEAGLVEREPTVSNRPSPAADTDGGTSRLGVTVTPLTPRLAGELDLSPHERGLVVTRVDPAGAAAEAGLERGDVITDVNGRRVDSASAFDAAVKARPGKPALALVIRRGASFFVALPAPVEP